MNKAQSIEEKINVEGGSLGSSDQNAPEQVNRLLFPNPRRNPYYIVAPGYTQRSAGVKALHMLCHALNSKGERAYITPHLFCNHASCVNQDLLNKSINVNLITPLLTTDIVEHDYETGLVPIVIYPEIIPGNPLNAPFVVRYVLNYPGLLGGDVTYQEEEFCVTYSLELASSVPNTQMTLFIPTSDPHVFTPEPRAERRMGTCFYAGKYQEDHGGKLHDITLNSAEIYRDPVRAQTTDQIADLFRRSEVFYAYENTALAIEAILCECPVVFLPNEYLIGLIGAHELGRDGIAWGADEAEIKRAKATVKNGRENYLRLFKEFERSLLLFIERTQKEVVSIKYLTRINNLHVKMSDQNLVIESGLFDKRFYLYSNPEVAVTGVDPVEHFCRLGWLQGMSPNPDFDMEYYLRKNVDVAEARINPFLHWLKFGQYEGRAINERCADRVDMDKSILNSFGINVLVLSLDKPHFACAEIRIIGPLGRSNDVFNLTWGVVCDGAGNWRLDTDLIDSIEMIVIQRFFPGAETAGVIDQLKASGKPLVYDVDDLLTDIPMSNPHNEWAHYRRSYIESCMRTVNAVIVSTPYLRDCFELLNNNIIVLPNYIDEVIWRSQPLVRTDSIIRILFAGTLTHSEDIALILPVLERIKAIHGDTIQLVFMGINPSEYFQLGEFEFVEFDSNYRSYANTLKHLGIDIALVPLVNNTFNCAKSQIKWLEYSALGIPAIFSDLAPYSSVEHGRTGLKVSNTPEEWFDNIDLLIRSSELRLQLGQAAQEEVLEKWTIQSNIHVYSQAYQKIFEDAITINKMAEKIENVGKFMQVLPWLWESRRSIVEQSWIQDYAYQIDGHCEICVRLLGDNVNLLSASRTSVAEQWLKPILAKCESNDNSYFKPNKSASYEISRWLTIVDAGDQLAPDAIFRIQMAVQNHPEWQLIYTDEDSLTADGQHVNPHCKPDFNIDYLRSLPYIGGLLVIKKELFEALGGFDPQADGAEDYDFVLRAWEKIGDAGIGHIPEVLYHRLQGGGHCNKSVEEILQVSQAALQRHLQRLNIAAEVLPGPFPPATRVRYPLTGTPLVSIIIPTRNQLGYLQRCVESLIEKTRYAHYEILIVDNDSDDAEARTYLDMLKAQEEQLGGRLRVLRHPGPFNFSAMNNRAVEQARGDYVLLLNNDTAALHDDWLDEMVSQILRPEVGIVGAKLLFPDGKIQHAGVILGMRGPAEHPFIGQPPEYRGYFGRAMLTQNLSAVTGACLLIKKSLYQELGGLDEKQFQVSYNDIDLCLKAREAGHKIVFTPWAMLLHEGSASQRGEVEKKPSPEKEKRFAGEKMAFYQKWLPQLAFDPAYNRHLSLASTDFLLEDQAALTWDPEWRPRPRILVHPADREGCGEYRIISPMRALQKAGRAQGWETMRIFEPAEMERFSPESIVLQRQMEWPQIEALERHKKLLKTFRVFEIDDLITNLPVKSLHKAQIHKDIAKRFRKAAGLCNRLVVATEPLAKAYKGFADEVRVQPNCIEEAIWGSLQPRRRAEAKPRVGWAGGVGHTGDLEMIADVVRDLADEVDWVFFGLCPDALRPYVREFHTGVPLPQYPNKLASLDLDLALAPLENNSFNEAKSHLRILEYGILGYPVICSDIFPYQGDFPVTRVANRYRDWVRAIREQIADRQALEAAGDCLREHVRAHWLLEEHLDDWLAAWLP